MKDEADPKDVPPAGAEQPTNTVGKGKQKEATHDSTDSIMHRIHASGRMALNAMATTQDWSNQFPGTKAGAGPSSVHGRSATSGTPGEAFSSSQRIRPPGLGESLRGAKELATTSQSFDDFVQHSALGSSAWTHPGNKNTATTEQEATDGSAVFQLLDTPNELEEYQPADDNTDTLLSLQEARNLHQCLFASTASSMRWDDLLNFIPDFLDDATNNPVESQLHMGTDNPAEARRIWLQQWGDVLSSYTDRVWGDLEPLAAEARHEVELLSSRENVSSDRPPEAKALHRLRMILAHVRGRV